MTSRKCLLVRTPDSRNLFVDLACRREADELAALFGTEAVLVRAAGVETLGPDGLVQAFCDGNFRQAAVYRPVPSPRPRRAILAASHDIQDAIRSQLLAGQAVSLAGVRQAWQAQHGLTTACLCNHLKRAVRRLRQEGHAVVKTGRGRYQLSSG